MNMYSIGDASIMVVIVACFMMVGALSYYFNSRIINLERTIVKQNHVLTNFISNVKNNTLKSCVEEIVPIQTQEIITPSHFSEKIGVSDSEYSQTCDSESSSEFHDNTKNNDMNDVIQISSYQQLSTEPIVELVDDVQKCTVKLGDLETVEQLDNLSASSGPISHDENESCTITSTGNSIDFTKMKLNQLKDIASSKGIDVKGKKKNDLVESLNKQ